jgi:hypothetical protein
MAAIITQIDPITFEESTLTPQDSSLISSTILNSFFSPSKDYIEAYIFYTDGTLFDSNINYVNYTINNNLIVDNGYDELNLDIEGYFNSLFSFSSIGPQGNYNLLYNFLENKFGSNSSVNFFIQEISSDGKELKLYSNSILPQDINLGYTDYINEKSDSVYLDNYYINFGGNNLFSAVNFLTQVDNGKTYLLVKLYQPLSSNYQVKDQLWVVKKVSDSVAYSVSFPPVELVIPSNTIALRGPNTNLVISDKINNSTVSKNYDELVATNFSSSLNQLHSILEDKSIEINIDYSEFENFSHFGSSLKRLENFFYKVGQIEQYSNELNDLYSNISGPTTGSYYFSASLEIIQNKITDIIQNFDGYEYYLYYESSSVAYPKQNFNPIILYSTGSIEAINWASSSFYSASIYDEHNQDYLHNVVPDYLLSNPDNQQYLTYINMMGQFFDNIFIYIKALTEKLDADNRLYSGVSKDIVSDTLESLGFSLYQNNFTENDLYSSLIGIPYSQSSFLTGSELITDFVTASLEGNTSSSIFTIGDLNEKIYKRIYNSLPYLLKKKGTPEGLRALANIYGIPDTILRIKEYGGNDVNKIDNYDYNYDRYSYAFNNKGVSTVIIPWVRPDFNNILGKNIITPPSTIMFRFKPDSLPSVTGSQVILNKSFDAAGSSSLFTLELLYTGSLSSGSYSGSIPNEYNNYGTLIFKIVDPVSSSLSPTCSVYLPFYDGDWWSVMVTKNPPRLNPSAPSTYTLYAGNKIYSGEDGNSIGFLESSSMYITSSTYNLLWNQTSLISGNYVPYGIFLGGNSYGLNFTGSFQEFRYYSEPLESLQFKDYVMNPKSIEGLANESFSSSLQILTFRAPLGNELEAPIIIGANTSSNYNSYHPGIGLNPPFESFTYSGSFTGSFYTIVNKSSSQVDFTEANRETYYFNQPLIGFRLPNADRIKLVESNSYGDILSPVRRIQQDNNYEPYNTSSLDIINNNNYMEFAFSPQDEVNDDIVDTLGYFNIGDYIGDPRQLYAKESLYPNLKKLRDFYFLKYNDAYDILDYLRLIKYFDNSLFKLVKDFSPVYANLVTGAVIKPTILERSPYKLPQASREYKQYSGSIAMESITGSTGGSTQGAAGEDPFLRNFISDFTQSFEQYIDTPLGPVTQSNSYQYELYNGEFNGSEIEVVGLTLNGDNPFLTPPTNLINYNLYSYTDYTIGDTTVFSKFLNPATTPNSGEIFVYFKPYLISGGGVRYNASYIKINKTDLTPENNTFYIQNITNIVVSYANGINRIYNVVNISEQTDYYIIEVDFNNQSRFAPQLLTNTYSNIEDYKIIATSSGQFITGSPSVFTEYIINLYTASYNPEGWLDTASGYYTPQYTSNTLLNFSGSLRIVNYSTSSRFFQFTLKSDNEVLFNEIQIVPGGVTAASSSISASNYTCLEGENIYLSISTNASAFSLSSGSFIISQSNAPTSSNPSFVIFEPYTNQNFNESDYNALQNNAIISRRSNVYFDVDYNEGMLSPVNFDAIIDQNAVYADIQDYYYYLQRHILPRYLGSKTTCDEINRYSPGDISYGKTPNVENNKTYFAYYEWIGGFPPEFKDMSGAKIKFILDEQGQVYNPKNLPDLYYYNLINNFEQGSNVILSPFSVSSGINAPGVYAEIYKAGKAPTPILYSQTGSDVNPYPTISFEPGIDPSIPDFTFLNGNINQFIFNTPTVINFANTPVSMSSNLTWNTGGDYITITTNPNPSATSITINTSYNIAASNSDITVEIQASSSGTFTYDWTTIKSKTYSNQGGLYVIDDTLSTINMTPNVGLSYRIRMFSNGATGILNLGSFYTTQTNSPLTEVYYDPGNSLYYFTTGSSSKNVLTGSQFTSKVYGRKQISLSGSGYFDIIYPFEVKVGDEIRFSYNEELAFYIKNITTPYEEDNTLYLTLNSDIPDGTELNSFLIRRLVDDPSFVMLRGTGLPNTTGFMTPEFVTQGIKDNFPNIIENLSAKNLIS